MTDESPLILQIAQAIEGPWDFAGFMADRLALLRYLRWSKLSVQEKGMRKAEARSVIKELGLDE